MIEINGYHILREVGRGDAATVYLARQESAQRDVALKVMSPVLLVDPDFSERFEHEARIAANLRHRDIASVYDVGRSSECNYIAMEFFGGGPVLAHDGHARPVTFALRVAREIALALEYAHAKGVVHGDVKPDNILLREDGSSALTDFCIAHVTHVRGARTNAARQYLSPEQARGNRIDGRADLYSLGIVLYEMLLGHTPDIAQDSSAAGAVHAVPVLPDHMTLLQPLLARVLARRPEDRYQTGAQLAAAISQIELVAAKSEPAKPVAQSETRNDVIAARRNDAVNLDDLPSLRSTRTSAPQRAHETPVHHTESHERVDPVLGRLDDLNTTNTYHRVEARNRSRKRRASRIGWVVAALILAALGAGLWMFQDQLRALIPNNESNGLIVQAQQALNAGRLIGDADSARELFQRARAIDPDNDAARSGLNEVGARLVDETSNALSHNDLDTARTDLGAAAELLGSTPRISDLQNQLRAIETRSTQTEDLLAQADAALAANKLTGDNSASALYRRVLDSDAGNAVAARGLEKTAKALAQSASAAITQGDADTADQRISDIAQIAPNDHSLPELRAALTILRNADAQALESDLAGAENALRQGRLNGNDGAQALFESVIKRDAGNTHAREGLHEVGLRYASDAHFLLSKGNIGGAQDALRKAEMLAGDAPEVRAMRQALISDVRESEDAAQQQSAEPTLADRARAEELLGEADRELAMGNLMDPGGAYDDYRAALRLDGNNTRAMDGLKRIAPRARTLFDQALGADKPNTARGFLEAVAETDPGNAALPIMRERLAGAYLDQAEARIAQGQRNDALRALNAARELSPANPRNAAIEARLQGAPVGG